MFTLVELQFDDSTWIIADTHFFHANIGQYCARPEGWQDMILENRNRYIKPGDIVFHLGDLALGKKEDTEAMCSLYKWVHFRLKKNKEFPMTDSTMEHYILKIVSNMHFTPNRLAICNAFYNAEGALTLKDVAHLIGKTRRSQIAGILSKLAQVIDYSGDPPGARYNFTGYILFFERVTQDTFRIRPEFKNVLDKRPDFKKAMECPLDKIFSEYNYGLQ